MKVYLREYGAVIVVVTIILIMLLLGKTVYAKEIHNAILGSTSNIMAVGKDIGANEVLREPKANAGDVLDIEGSKYIVIEKKGASTYLLLSGKSIGNIQYQPNQDDDGNYKIGVSETPNSKRYDGKSSNTYEGSFIDNYLENTWYQDLPSSLKNAIQSTEITQKTWGYKSANTKWKYYRPEGESKMNWYYNEGTDSNPKWVIYHKANVPNDESGAYPYEYWSQSGVESEAITRHVFLPNVEEISNLVDLNNANKVYEFLKGTNNSLGNMILRDKRPASRYAIGILSTSRSIHHCDVTNTWSGVRPAFTVDLSKVDYTETGHITIQ